MPADRPDDWLFETLHRLEATEIRHAGEMRADMQAGFAALRLDFKTHETNDRLVENRVLTLENERDERRKQMMSRATMMALLAAIPGALLAIYTLMKVSH